MIKIDETMISITRGDSAYIQLDISDMSGEPVTLSSRDIVRCQVRKRPNDGELVFEGDIIRSDQDNSIVWHIHPEDTMNEFVGTYYWDAQVEFTNGDIFTFIPVSKFKLLPEITMVE